MRVTKLRRRKLVDWTDEAGPLEVWLARWADAGWVPEYAHGGVLTVVGGREVTRWAMVQVPANLPEGAACAGMAPSDG